MEKHFGELGLGNNGRSGSSRRGKKNNSDKPKQPQRGLGVAQLEKIRLHDQMASYLIPSLHSPFHSNLNKEDDLREEMAFSPSFYGSTSSATSASSPYHGLQANQQMMMFGDNESLDIRSYGDFSSCSSSRLYMPNNVVQETVTLPLLEETMEDSIQKKRREDRCRSSSTGSRSDQNSSDKSDTQELDLDLKL